MNCYLVRYAEIGIKSSQIRNKWLHQLRQNIERCLFWNAVSFGRVVIVQGRLIVYSDDKRAADAMHHVMGISSISPATEIDLDMEKLKNAALRIYRERNPKTFRISSQRVTKGYQLTSQEINEQIGEAVYEAGGTVSLTKYELNISFEIINDKAYVFTEVNRGVGGLPLGVQNVGCAVVKTLRDLVACWLFMRRGCPVEVVVYNTNRASIYVDILQSFACSGLRIQLINSTDDLNEVLPSYLGRGIEVVVSGIQIDVPEGMVNLCPCEIFTTSQLNDTLRMAGIVLPHPIENHMLSAGGIVYKDNKIFLFRRKDENTWLVPKGGVDNKEHFREAALREICEETGLCNVDIGDMVGKTQYSFVRGGIKHTKDVYYYLCTTYDELVTLEPLFDDYDFLSPDDAEKRATFENDKRMIRHSKRLRDARRRS
ncbi:MAG: NUDIX domain-containing protein [Candidatus Methanofastidiosia archaeon]